MRRAKRIPLGSWLARHAILTTKTTAGYTEDMNRDFFLRFRVTEDEYKAFLKEAAARGLSSSAFLRSLLTTHPEKPLPQPKKPKVKK